MCHFEGHFEGAKTFLTPLRKGQNRGQKRRGPLKMSREMAHKVIVQQKKIRSQSFLNSGTLLILCTRDPYYVLYTALLIS